MHVRFVSICGSRSNDFERFFVLVLDRSKIECFVVGFSTFPAAEDYTDPFKGERSYGAGVGFSFAALAFVKERCPLRVMEWIGRRIRGKFDKGILGETGAGAPSSICRYARLRERFRCTFESQWRRASGIDPNQRRIVIAEPDSCRRPEDSK